MPPRRRDSRGRFISSQPSEGTGDSTRDTDTEEEIFEDPSEGFDAAYQIQGEFEQALEPSIEEHTSIMADEIRIQEPGQGEAVKITRYQIEKLDRSNVSNWKHKIRNYLILQDCWEVVDYTYQNRNKPAILAKILNHPTWRKQNAKARIYIDDNVKEDDLTVIRPFETTGEAWAWLMAKYERYSEIDIEAAVMAICQWKKDPEKNIEDSLQEIERLNNRLAEVSNGETKIQSVVLTQIFLNGLPEEYLGVKSSMYGSGKLSERNFVLGSLQAEERAISLRKSTKPENLQNEFANR
ncbi:hypothetical protein LOZ66_003795, partial [Ophidiomyces ophidiicola]